ncbi:MAG: hypothetical protein MRY64_14005, partial [Hyphomonadaceae bacterium]|nr:hypothetical protein [Hyphomonadaceae bacterium]
MPNTPETWLDAKIANTTTAGAQSGSSITQLDNGNVLIAWYDAASGDMLGQIFDPAGRKVGAEVSVFQNTGGSALSDVEVFATTNGGFGATAIADDGTNTQIVKAGYDANGALQLAQFAFLASVPSSTSTIVHQEVTIASSTSGHVVWTEFDGTTYTTKAKTFDPSSNTFAADVTIAAATSAPMDIGTATLSDGNFAVGILEPNGPSTNFTSAVVTSAGALQAPANTISVGASSAIDTDMTMAASNLGGFAVSFANEVQAATVFFSNANAQQPGNFASSAGGDISLTALADGSYVLTSTDTETGTAIRVERFDTSGNAIGTVATIETGTGFSELDSVALEDGRFQISWTDSNGDIATEILDVRDTANVTTYAGQDYLIATAGGGTLAANVDAVVLAGDAADTVLESPSTGLTSFFLGAGDDTMSVNTFAAQGNTYDGGDGVDTLTSASTASITVDLGTNLFKYSSIQSDSKTVLNFENVTGNAGNDTLKGDSGANILDGGGGNDTFIADDTGDTLIGGDGIDTVDFSQITNSGGVIWDMTINVIYVGGVSGPNDTATGIENAIGTDFSDAISGDANDNRFEGGLGADALYGGDGADLLLGGEGNDNIYMDSDDIRSDVNGVIDLGGAGYDTLHIVNGSRFVTNGLSVYGFEAFRGAELNDRVRGNDGSVNYDLRGGGGNDRLEGNFGDDLLRGDDGADELIGNGGFDQASYVNSSAAVTVDLSTGTGTGGHAEGDTLSLIEWVIGSAFDDTLITSGTAVNRLEGGDGNDTIHYKSGDIVTSGGAAIDMGGAGYDTLVVQAGSYFNTNGLSVRGFEAFVGAELADDV